MQGCRIQRYAAWGFSVEGLDVSSMAVLAWDLAWVLQGEGVRTDVVSQHNCSPDATHTSARSTHEHLISKWRGYLGRLLL